MNTVHQLVTIVVPIYNVEDYLEKCLVSLSCQSLKSIRVLLIDDGSTDSSSAIAKRYVTKDNRFEYYYKDNGGLSSARNFGLEKVRSKYVAFVDSDDWVHPNMYLDMSLALEESEADIATCGMFLAYPDGELKEKKIKNGIYELSSLESYVELLNNIRVASWDKLYKTSLFINNDIRYPEGLYFEDTPTTASLVLCSDKVVASENSYYYYLQRQGSITKSVTFEDKYLDIFDGLKQARLKNSHREYSKNVLDYLFFRKCILDTILRFASLGGYRNEHLKFVSEAIDLRELIGSKLNNKYKAIILLYKINARLAIKLVRMIR